MNGQCSYLLEPRHIAGCYLRLYAVKIVLVGAALVAAAVGAIVWQVNAGRLSTMELTFALTAVVGLDLMAHVAVFFVMYMKAKNPRPLPGGITAVEWDAVGLTAAANREFVQLPWDAVHYRVFTGGDIILFFPNGRFTFVTRELVPETELHALRETLENPTHGGGMAASA